MYMYMTSHDCSVVLLYTVYIVTIVSMQWQLVLSCMDTNRTDGYNLPGHVTDHMTDCFACFVFRICWWQLRKRTLTSSQIS